MSVPVAVASAANSGFLPGLITALRSARSALPPATPMVAYLMITGVDETGLERLRSTIEGWGGTRCVIRDPTELLPPRLPKTERFSTMTYARLCLPDLVEDGQQRLIYMDADVVVRGDLDDLWQTDLQGKAAGAVRDFFFPFAVDGLPETHGSLGLPGDAPYFNAGVLLMDVSRWRAIGASERILQYTLENWDTVRYADQDGVSALLGHEIQELDVRWNVQVGLFHDLLHRSKSDFLLHRPENAWQRDLVKKAGQLLREGRVWHFVGGKPWTGNAIRLGRMSLLAEAEYIRHAAGSGYFTGADAGRLLTASIAGLSSRLRNRLPRGGPA